MMGGGGGGGGGGGAGGRGLAIAAWWLLQNFVKTYIGLYGKLAPPMAATFLC